MQQTPLWDLLGSGVVAGEPQQRAGFGVDGHLAVDDARVQLGMGCANEPGLTAQVTPGANGC